MINIKIKALVHMFCYEDFYFHFYKNFKGQFVCFGKHPAEFCLYGVKNIKIKMLIHMFHYDYCYFTKWIKKEIYK